MAEISLKTIGERVKALRKESKLSQSDIANYLNLDQSNISKIESGERSLSTGSLEKLANLFGCPVGYFINNNHDYQPISFSLRAKNISRSDFEAIADINKIALNLQYMAGILENNKN